MIHIKHLKQALNPGLVLKKVHRVIKFNQKAWLKPYIDMNNELTIKLVTPKEEPEPDLLSKRNFHTAKISTQKFIGCINEKNWDTYE